MAQKVWTEVYDTEDEARHAVSVTLRNVTPGYSERYIDSGPKEAVATDGQPCWTVTYREYSG